MMLGVYRKRGKQRSLAPTNVATNFTLHSLRCKLIISCVNLPCLTANILSSFQGQGPTCSDKEATT